MQRDISNKNTLGELLTLMMTLQNLQLSTVLHQAITMQRKKFKKLDTSLI